MEIHHQMLVDKQEDNNQHSPPHEFTFTVSLHPSATATNIPEKNKPPPPSPLPFAAIDLSPADDIFFHGHLLPLHLLSHLSPRSSTNSLADSFTLPITKQVSRISGGISHHHDHHQESNLLEGNARVPEKPKIPLISLFGLPRRRKEDSHNQEHDHHHRQKRKSKFDVSNVMQRYMRMIKPFLVSFIRSKYRRSAGNIIINNNNPHEQIIHDHQRRHDELSFSGNLLKVRRIKKGLMRGRRGEYSAPASMRNSPANSGILVKGGGSGTLTPKYTCNKSDSTMEELQAAIQDAIAHCKNSISTDQDYIS